MSRFAVSAVAVGLVASVVSVVESSPALAGGSVGTTSQSVEFISSPPDPGVVGASYAPTVTATSGLVVKLSRDATSTGCTLSAGVVSFTGVGTCVLDANQAGNKTFAAAPQVQQSISVIKASQTVTFTTSPPSAAFVGATYTPTASASSGLVVRLSRDASSTGCTMSAGVVTFTRAGLCVLDARQAGNSKFAAAVLVQQMVAVSKIGQSISFTSSAPAPALVGAMYLPTATSTSGLATVITLGTASVGCTLSGGLVSFTGAGICIVSATQAGNGTYAAAVRVRQSIQVFQNPQTVSFTSTAPAPASVLDEYVPTASASSGLDVVFALAATSTGCTLTAGVVSFTAAGTCVILADQPGDAEFSQADEVSQSIDVVQKAQTVSFTSDAPTPGLAGTTYSVSATATSGLQVAISSSTPLVCTISDAVVTFITSGECVLAADQSGDTVYSAASTVTQIIEVDKQDQTLAFTSTAPAAPAIGATYTPTATATSGLDAVITLDAASSGCTIDAGVVTFTAAGTCVIDADQSGDATFNAATETQQSILVPEAATAVADAASVARYSTANTINVLTNDLNPSGNAETITAVTQPANGIVSIAADSQSVLYTPTANYCNSDASNPNQGDDTFTYTLNGVSTATVSVTVVAPDLDPTITSLTRQRTTGAVIPITDFTPQGATANAIRDDATNVINVVAVDKAACASNTLSYYWGVGFPGIPDFRDAGINGVFSPTVTIVKNALLTATNNPGATFYFTITSTVTHRTTQRVFSSIIISSELTVAIFNSCQAGGPCSIPAALPPTY